MSEIWTQKQFITAALHKNNMSSSYMHHTILREVIGYYRPIITDIRRFRDIHQRHLGLLKADNDLQRHNEANSRPMSGNQ